MTLLLLILSLNFNSSPLLANELGSGEPSNTPSRQSPTYSVPRNYFYQNNDEGNNSFNEFTSLYDKFKGDPKLAKSQTALQRALAFYAKNKNGIPSQCGGDMGNVDYRDNNHPPVQKIDDQQYILISDYTLPNDTDRFFILDTQTGKVESCPVAHGYGSNKNCPKEHQISCGDKGIKCAIPTTMGNTDPSVYTGITSRGFFLTDAGYTSAQPTFTGGKPQSSGINALALRGLVKDVNDNALKRDIVFHRASYAGKQCSSSAGCPAICPQLFEDYKDKLGRSLMYIHTIDDEKLSQPDC